MTVLQYFAAALAGALAALLTIALVMRFRARRRVAYVDIQRWFKIRESKIQDSRKGT
jgi:hypothetical protein